MTNQDFISLLKSSEKVNSDYIPDLKSMLEYYPYFTLAHLLHLRAIQQTNNINFEQVLNTTSLYVKDRRWLYNFVYPKSGNSLHSSRVEKKSGDYFDMIETIEGDGRDMKQSLSELAERLKKARLLTVDISHAKPADNKPIDNRKEESEGDVDYAEKIRLLMQQRKYHEALEILKELNLNNPKKNVYFADQIRFLEKIIENLKK